MSDAPNPLSEAETLAADVDGDGAVSLTDAQLILLYYTNRLTDNPVTWDDLLGK